ncbi:hypothetical protein [Treponema sp.]|uniref:hypothetical protein n=1 Tax=Treponema sp. TaxID=166 RepID=UPI00388E2FE0
MKKVLSTVLVLFFTAFCFAEKKIYVNTNSADLMNKKSLFGKMVTKVSYGAELIVLDADGDWTYVQVSGKPSIKGWVKTNKTSERKISSKGSANAKEIALAGKGFSAEIENLYANSENGNYKAVDELEKSTQDMAKLNDFIEEGKLKGGDR